MRLDFLRDSNPPLAMTDPTSFADNESPRGRVLHAASKLLLGAGLSDFLSFLTPKLIAGFSDAISRDDPDAAPVAESTIRHHFRSGARSFDRTLLIEAMLGVIRGPLLGPLPPPAEIQDLAGALTYDFDGAWDLRKKVWGQGMESLLLLAFLAADSDAQARTSLLEVDRWFVREIELQYETSFPDPAAYAEASQLSRVIADVRYGEMLSWRVTGEIGDHAQRHRDAVVWLLQQLTPKNAARGRVDYSRIRHPGLDGRNQRSDGANTRLNILKAAFAAIGCCNPLDLYAFLTPSSLAAAAEPPLDRTSVAKLYSDPESSAFLLPLLVAHLHQTSSLPDDESFLEAIGPVPDGAFDTPGVTEYEVFERWQRITLLDCVAAGPFRWKVRPIERRMELNFQLLKQLGRQPLEPQAESLELATRAVQTLLCSTNFRPRLGKVVDRRQLEGYASYVMTTWSEPIPP